MDITNLPATLDEVSREELQNIMGQGNDDFGLNLPSLRVNYDDMDDDGNKIPRGEFVLFEDGKPVYAPEAEIRIMYCTYQYSHFDADEMKMVSKSVHNFKLGDEFPDDAGGMKCGKLPRKVIETLSKPEQEYQRKIKLSRVMFVTATIRGKNAQGEDAEHVDVPAVLYAKGTNFMPMTDHLKALEKIGKLPADVITKLSLERQKNGQITFWTIVPEVAREVKLTDDDLLIINDFAATVKAENSAILGKWDGIKSKEASGSEAQDLLTRIIDAPDDDDLNDELPNLG